MSALHSDVFLEFLDINVPHPINENKRGGNNLAVLTFSHHLETTLGFVICRTICNTYDAFIEIKKMSV